MFLKELYVFDLVLTTQLLISLLHLEQGLLDLLLVERPGAHAHWCHLVPLKAFEGGHRLLKALAVQVQNHSSDVHLDDSLLLVIGRSPLHGYLHQSIERLLAHSVVELDSFLISADLIIFPEVELDTLFCSVLGVSPA
jgi:hypothetical protein